MEAVSTAVVDLVGNNSTHLDDNQNILITMCILGQWSDMIEMKNITLGLRITLAAGD